MWDKPRKEEEHNKKIEKFLSLLNEGIYESKIKIKNSNNSELANEQALIQQLENLTSDIANIEYKRNQTDNDEEKELLNEQLKAITENKKIMEGRINTAKESLINNDKIEIYINKIEKQLKQISENKLNKKDTKPFRVRKG